MVGYFSQKNLPFVEKKMATKQAGVAGDYSKADSETMLDVKQ